MLYHTNDDFEPPRGENCHMGPGDFVVLQNLPNPTFNGRTARLKYWDSRARMWNVEMVNGVQFNIFESNMVMPCQSSRPTTTTTAPRTTSAVPLKIKPPRTPEKYR